MDTDGSRRHIQNVIIKIISIIAYFSYNFNMDKIYIISTSSIVNTVKDLLLKEGFYIEKKYKGVYIIYPVLYGERD